ncbi:16S rRNA methyltransferase [Candidatus Micrarchaeota archaeon]|nr:16S rRNA methyltransferase [Candidatus Micrarchaeota archaeon]
MKELLFVESSLELVPRELQKTDVVRKNALKRNKPPSELLLDYSVHWQAMGELKNKEKRGRPDIAHDVLKLAFDSGLELKVRMHTINNLVIDFASDWRIPRNYNQFVGLMEKLLVEKKITDPKGRVLLQCSEKTKLGELLKGKILVLDAKGKKTTLKELPGILEKYDVIVIGAFPHGDFLNDLSSFENIALGEKELTAPAVTYRVLAGLEYD